MVVFALPVGCHSSSKMAFAVWMVVSKFYGLMIQRVSAVVARVGVLTTYNRLAPSVAANPKRKLQSNLVMRTGAWEA